jgi:hypothetical protein
MARYEMQSTDSETSRHTGSLHLTDEQSASKGRAAASGQSMHSEAPAQDPDPVLRTLVLLQRQQREQTVLLRQLLEEIEALKQNQSQQSATVIKLERRIARAQLWRVGWLAIRWSLVIVLFGSIIYFIGVERILNYWARLVWLLT